MEKQMHGLLAIVEHMAGYEDHLDLFVIALCRAADELEVSIVELRDLLASAADETEDYAPATWMDWLHNAQDWEDFCRKSDMGTIVARERRLQPHAADSSLPCATVVCTSCSEEADFDDVDEAGICFDCRQEEEVEEEEFQDAIELGMECPNCGSGVHEPCHDSNGHKREPCVERPKADCATSRRTGVKRWSAPGSIGAAFAGNSEQ